MATPPGIVSTRYFLWVGELRRTKSTPLIGVTRKIGGEPFGSWAKTPTVQRETSKMSWPLCLADNASPSLFFVTQNPLRAQNRPALGAFSKTPLNLIYEFPGLR